MVRMALITCILVWGVTQQAFCFQPARKLSNQEMAEKIATALSDADLGGNDIQITFQAGVATLEGRVASSAEKTRASDIVSQISGVEKTVNSLRAADDPTEKKTESVFGDAQTVPEENGEIKGVPFPRLTNQQIAEKIAAVLRAADLQGMDISIEYRAGQLILSGSVLNSSQKQKATDVAARIPGVDDIINSLRVTQTDENKLPQPVPEDTQNASKQAENQSAALQLMPIAASIPPTMLGNFLLGKRLMTRQQELFESDRLHKIEVSVRNRNKTTLMYDIYCGRKQLVIISHSGGSNFASFEGTLVNAFQGGLYKWTTEEQTGIQYECQEQDLLQFFRYVTDVGGFMTQLYMESQLYPDLFLKPINREDGFQEYRLKRPRYGILSIVASHDPLWLHELSRRDADGFEHKTIYGLPTEVDELPVSIARDLKDVKFEPTQGSIFSLMPFP